MVRLTKLARRFAKHRGGATAVEYGLLVALLSLVVVVGVRGAGVSLFSLMNNTSAQIAGAHP